MLKKRWIWLAVVVMGLAVLLAGCGSSSSTKGQEQGSKPGSPVTLKVEATPIPHAQILQVVKPILAKEGVNLDIITANDYIMPNRALADKEIDANFFQHIPYLEDFNKKNHTDLTWITKVHIEPMGIYSAKYKSLKDVPQNPHISIPNDPTNGGRALLLLQKAGLLKLKPGVSYSPTVNDIVDSKVRIIPMDAAQLPRTLKDVDLAVINTNFALEGKLDPQRDALFMESPDSPYANVLVVRKGDENRPEIQKLAKALTSPAVKEFIESKYKGAIVPAF